MKKETSIAILLGISFGVILSLVLIAKTKDKALEKTKTLSNEKKTTIVIGNSTSSSEQTFKVLKPQDREITTQKNIAIKGSADKDSLIIIQSPIKDVVFKNDKTEFSIDFPLALGENIIQISLYPKDIQTRIQQKELRVYLLEE